MNCKLIVEQESQNTSEIRLYREGLFWKAYERSAYAFYTRVKPFKLTKRYVKLLSDELVSLGFPASQLTVLFPADRISLQTDEQVCIRTEPIDVDAFPAWKAGIALMPAGNGKKTEQAAKQDMPPACRIQAAPPVCAVTPFLPDVDETAAKQVVLKLMDYNLADSTPMETMQFVSELKMLLKRQKTEENGKL